MPYRRSQRPSSACHRRETEITTFWLPCPVPSLFALCLSFQLQAGLISMPSWGPLPESSHPRGAAAAVVPRFLVRAARITRGPACRLQAAGLLLVGGGGVMRMGMMRVSRVEMIGKEEKEEIGLQGEGSFIIKVGIIVNCVWFAFLKRQPSTRPPTAFSLRVVLRSSHHFKNQNC